MFVEFEGLYHKLSLKDMSCFTALAATQMIQPYQRILKLH